MSYPYSFQAFSGVIGPASGWTNSLEVQNVMWYPQTLFVLYNRGSSGATYEILATPNYYVRRQWVRIFPKPGETNTINSSGIRTHKLTDAWDAVFVRMRMTISGGTTNMRLWINHKGK